MKVTISIFYEIWKFRTILKYVNSTPVQAVTNLTYIRQLIGTKFFRMTVYSD